MKTKENARSAILGALIRAGHTEQWCINMLDTFELEVQKAYLSEIKPKLLGSHVTEPEQVGINPEDMVKGEWYVVKDNLNGDFLFKFNELIGLKIYYYTMVNYEGSIYIDDWMDFHGVYDYIIPATRSEVLKYFPDEKFNDHTPINGC